jgi:hypothetical protein
MRAIVLSTSKGFPDDHLQRLRRVYEKKRLDQVKRFHESLKKIATEERDTWFPTKKKTDEPVEESDD